LGLQNIYKVKRNIITLSPLELAMVVYLGPKLFYLGPISLYVANLLCILRTFEKGDCSPL